MSVRESKGNFLSAHYDWFALMVAVGVLVVAALFYKSAKSLDPEAETAAAASEFQGVKKSSVKPVDMAAYEATLSQLKAPVPLREVADDEANFLASATRVFCGGCHEPIPAGLKNCPLCKVEQAQEPDPSQFDSDQDGIPDEWEKRMGLNIEDPADAAQDADGDGFTNLEEFLAKTDPTSTASHPPYIDSLKVVGPLKKTFVPFFFQGGMKTPNGVKLTFRDPMAKSGYGGLGVTYQIYEGKPIEKTGFVAKKFTARQERVAVKGARDAAGKQQYKDVDASVVLIERLSDGKTIELKVDKRNVPLDLEASLRLERGAGASGKGFETYTVVVGDEINLRGLKYKVKAINSGENGSSVVLEEVGSGKIHTLPVLEQ